MTYDFEVSSLDYPSEDYFNAFLKEKSLPFVANRSSFALYRQSSLVLNVFYPSTKYVDIVQAPKTSLIDLIANLGGAIGIFLGFSIFSLVEFVEIFVRLLLISMSKGSKSH